MTTGLFELILAVRRRCQSKLDEIQRDLGLSQAEFNGLLVLEDGQEVLGGHFAERLGLSPSRGSRVVNRLVTGGYVKTHCSAEDRRAIHISLTPQGKRMRRRILNRIEGCETRISEKLDAESVGQIRHALGLLKATL